MIGSVLASAIQMTSGPDNPFVLSLVVLCSLFCACDEAREAAPPEAVPAPESTETAHLNIDDPTSCAPCHSDIVAEWTGSMHSQAHHSADPVYAAMRDFRVAREGESVEEKCAGCHGPRAVDDLDGVIAHTGVSCATCHNLSDVTEGRGVYALQYASDDTLRGPRDEDNPAHALGPGAPFLADGRTVCLACHGSLSNAQGAATCTTKSEFSALAGADSCTTCHMPEASGAGAPNGRTSHRAHVFVGPHALWNESSDDDDFMATAVTVSGQLSGDTLQVSIANQTGHAMPTGFPGRMMLVRVLGFDVEGEQVYVNFTDDPMRQDPAAVFNKVYVNSDDEVVMPPYGTRIIRDSRLTPGETRALLWTVPASVVRAEVKLLFRLLPPPAARALGIPELPESAPRLFSTTTLERTTTRTQAEPN